MPSSGEIVNWLEAHDAIRLGESPWPTVADDEDVFRINWSRLFPTGRSGQNRGSQPLFGLDDEEGLLGQTGLGDAADGFAERIRDALAAAPPTDAEAHDLVEQLQWDVCAWYQPMHFFARDWGIFIKRDCILRTIDWIARFLPDDTPLTPSLLEALIRAGFAVFFLHEQFHHKTESLGVRLHVIENVSRYLPYVENVYKPTRGDDKNLEEAVANADAFARLASHPYRTWMGDEVTDAVREYLKWRFPFDPPGYRMADRYFGSKRLNKGIDLLHGQIQEAVLKPVKRPADWNIASRLHQSQFKVTDHLWEVVPKESPHPLVRGAVHPVSISSRDLIRLAEVHGWEQEPKSGKGSHVKMKKAGAPPLTIPGGRSDLSQDVLKTTLNSIGGYKIRDIPTLRKKL